MLMKYICVQRRSVCGLWEECKGVLAVDMLESTGTTSRYDESHGSHHRLSHDYFLWFTRCSYVYGCDCEYRSSSITNGSSRTASLLFRNTLIRPYILFIVHLLSWKPERCVTPDKIWLDTIWRRDIGKGWHTRTWAYVGYSSSFLGQYSACMWICHRVCDT